MVSMGGAPLLIPAWTPKGVLPAHTASNPMSSAGRSPYEVSLVDCVLRFGTTQERRAILAGYLAYRAALHEAGLVRGFQWLNGSFCEDVETIEGRAPNDLDVVSFYHLPPSTTQAQLAALHPDTFDKNGVKARWKVDGYTVSLGGPPERLIERGAYWYGAWSHRRDDLWKGFLQVNLEPNDDPTALITLANLAITAAPSRVPTP